MAFEGYFEGFVRGTVAMTPTLWRPAAKKKEPEEKAKRVAVALEILGLAGLCCLD